MKDNNKNKYIYIITRLKRVVIDQIKLVAEEGEREAEEKEMQLRKLQGQPAKLSKEDRRK